MTFLATFCFLGGAKAQQTLPYEYGFENNDLSADGWVLQGATSDFTTIDPRVSRTGSYGFSFNYHEQRAYLMSPIFTGTDNGIDVYFWYKKQSDSYVEQFQVGYTTDETVTDASAFTYGDVVTASTSWLEFERIFPAGTKRIAIKYIYNKAYYLYLDDFTFMVPPSCPKPMGVSISAITNESAVVSWISDVDTWNVRYRISGTDDWTVESCSTNASFTIEGLDAGVTYEVQVQADCGGGYASEWSSPVTFSTYKCVTLPYEYGFENNDLAADGWIANYTSQWSGITTYENHNSSYAFLFAFEQSGSLISPILMSGDDAVDVSFWCRRTQTSVYGAPDEKFLIGYTTDATVADASQFTYGDEVSVSSSEWKEYSKSFPVGTKRIAIKYIYQENAPSLVLDDFTFNVYRSCKKPKGLVASEITYNSVQLNWTPGEEGQDTWQICINDDEENLITVHNNPYTMGLTENTSYTVKVRAYCSDTEQSLWSNAVSFATPEQFPTPTELVYSDVTCNSVKFSWKDNGSATKWVVAYKAEGETDFTETEVTTKPYTLEGLQSGTAYAIKVRAKYDNDLSAWSSIILFRTECSDEDKCYIAYELKANDYEGSYENGWFGSYILVVDNVTGEVIANWTVPKNASNGIVKGMLEVCSGRPVRFEWHSESFFDDYFVGDIIVQDVNGEDIINTTGPLSENVIYTVDCSPTPTNIVADLKADGAVLTWDASGDSYNVRYRTMANSEVIFYEDFGRGQGDWTTYNLENGGGAMDGLFAFRSTTNSPQYLISPKLNGIAAGATLTFYCGNYHSLCPESFKVGYSTTTNDVDAFTWSAETTVSNTQWNLYEQSLPADVKYISIQCTSYNQYYFLVDEIVICNSPTTAGSWQSLSVGTATATLNGLATNNAYEYQVQSVMGGETTKWSKPREFALLSLQDVLLSDNPSNTSLLLNNYGRQSHVTIQRSFLTGVWNALCLPFDISNVSSSALGDVTVKELNTNSSATYFNDESGVLNLSFKEVTNGIEAGMPYIIKGSNTIENPQFANVTIKSTSPTPVFSADGKVSFLGLYSPLTTEGEDRSLLFLGVDDNLYYPNAAVTIKAFRAYFPLHGITAGDKVLTTRMIFGDGEITGILDADREATIRNDWYTIDGKKLDQQPTRKGLYINNGVKVVIK